MWHGRLTALGVWKRRDPCYSWWEQKLVQPLWRIVWRFIKTLEFPYDPAMPLLGTDPEKTNCKRYMHPRTHCSTVHSSQDMETA